MESPVKMASESPAAASDTLPPAKKLKQARLPFKVLPAKPASQPASPPNVKKRKLSDSATVLQKAPKAPKNEKSRRSQSRSGDAENEVSSSSEADIMPKPGSGDHCDREKLKHGLLDKFVQKAQQGEVSTSGQETFIDLTEESESREADSSIPEADVKKGEDENISKQSENKNNIPSEKPPEDKENQPVEESTNSNTSSQELDVDDENDQSADEGDVSMVSDEGKASQSSQEDEQEKSVDSLNTSLDSSLSTPNTPKTDAKPKGRAKTPGSLKKQAEKEAEKQKKKEEREKLRAKKLKQKEEEKKKKEQQRLEEKEKKEKEKMELKMKKDKEKQEKEEQKRKEREEKERLKEEEKKKKMEIMEAKNEEKRKKEEEKKKKDEEKRKLEEEEARKKQKIQSAFKSFFNKTERSPKQEKPEVKGMFIGFEVKKDMRLAPAHRIDTNSLLNKMKQLDQLMTQQDCSKLYLKQLTTGEIKPGCYGTTFPHEYPDSDVECTDDQKPEQPLMRAKFLKFRENYRPPYYGTWRKKSKFINPRNPLKKDEDQLDYEVDSDDEWEEEEPGESLSDSEGEDKEDKEGDEEDEEEGDGFFVPHGYLSDDEGCEEDEEEEDVNPEKKKIRQMMKTKAWEQEMKSKCHVLRAMFVGPCWIGPNMQEDPAVKILSQYKAVLLTSGPIEIDSGPVIKSDKSGRSEDGRGCKIQAVPEDAMPDLIRLVHGNTSSVAKIIKEFREYWKQKENSSGSPESSKEREGDRPATPSTDSPNEGKSSMSKRQLDMKIRSIAVYEKREGFKKNCWYVHQSCLDQYKVTDVTVPNTWVWLTRTPVPEKQATAQTDTPSPQTGKLGNIKKFTVANMSPQFMSPPPQQKSGDSSNPNSPVVNKSPAGSAAGTPKRTPVGKTLNPAMLFFKKRTPSGGVKEKKNIISQIISVNTDSDDDCMIVDESPPLPLKSVDKSQPSVLSMFSVKTPSSSTSNSQISKPPKNEAADVNKTEVKSDVKKNEEQPMEVS